MKARCGWIYAADVSGCPKTGLQIILAIRETWKA